MTTTLRPQLEALRQMADTIRSKAKRLEGLTTEQLAWSPGGGRWSVLQVLDHLNKTHALCAPKFREALENAPEAGDERDRLIKLGIMDRVFLKFMSGEAPIKAPVPPIFEPDRTPDRKNTLRRFFEFHDDLVRVVNESERHRLEGLRATSPVSDKFRPGYFAYLLGTFLHEQYHWGQIEALLADPSFPKR